MTSRRELLQVEPLPFDESAAPHERLLPELDRDPFDRGLVSQAILHGLTVVTPDPAITQQYPAPTLW